MPPPQNNNPLNPTLPFNSTLTSPPPSHLQLKTYLELSFPIHSHSLPSQSRSANSSFPQLSISINGNTKYLCVKHVKIKIKHTTTHVQVRQEVNHELNHKPPETKYLQVLPHTLLGRFLPLNAHSHSQVQVLTLPISTVILPLTTTRLSSFRLYVSNSSSSSSEIIDIPGTSIEIVEVVGEYKFASEVCKTRLFKRFDEIVSRSGNKFVDDAFIRSIRNANREKEEDNLFFNRASNNNNKNLPTTNNNNGKGNGNSYRKIESSVLVGNPQSLLLAKRRNSLEFTVGTGKKDAKKKGENVGVEDDDDDEYNESEEEEEEDENDDTGSEKINTRALMVRHRKMEKEEVSKGKKLRGEEGRVVKGSSEEAGNMLKELWEGLRVGR